ncbi:YfbR-like 5'-deoxynucleotidase [Paenibacillus sp. SEL3]|jgi:putative hydrolase of HD superfamily|uniref:HD domain-containing protein n=1 Tax=Paenibacillus polymyxa TaxID=1406 RepID=A0A8I1IWQ7_PAEPO|nr:MULTISPECIES: YfbR-like 5'-deoxynucleotidase [Paenibacillus]KAF6576106.1 HD domain-containing protein [Paenibacillus sp. EKM206P]KAF6589740.1 HD domain-containing protein [Paenibacillus sp. EKM205P]KEO78978.1 hydrolase [Paenibacillus polymyxa]MBM0634518.1 HD domain-containing protein [Paenibacillus polymyxa]MBO3284886.1 HD domain-containing protein [Paenibacillus polymyxa]
MGIHTYFRSLNELERIIRCPGKFKFEEHSVSAHSWKVVQYAKTLADIEERNGVRIDWKKLYEITSSHDYGEIFIGDIKTPVKHSSKELRLLIQQVEEGMIEYFIEENIPEDFKAIFRKQLREGKDDSVEGLILEVADKMDQVYEAFAELQRGNTEKEFIVMYRNALVKIKNIQLHCVEYFLENILPDMVKEETPSSIDIKKITEEALAL